VHALIVIDQQKGIDHPKLGSRNNPNAELSIMELLSVWRERNYPVIHVKHCSSELKSVFWPEQKGYDFKPEFQPLENEDILIKTVPCAFTNSSLEKMLRQSEVKSIVVVGVATNNSIESTARTGSNLGLNVFVVENACFAFEKNDYFGIPRSADDVHAMSLANLNGEYATVLSSSNLLKIINEI
jgi:nicotinamidase-related amidase